MPQKDIEKLLGGYATDTLTEQERKDLFAAALRDQTLFNALADEHALKEVLDDPRARRLLIDALKKKTTQRYWLENFLAWLRRPPSWALAGSVAVALVAVTLVIRLTGTLPEPPMIADSKAPVASSPAPPSVPKATDLPSQIQSETRQPQEGLSAKTEKRDIPSTEQAPSPVSPQAPVLKTPSPSLNKEEESDSRASQSVVPEAPASAPAGAPLKEQQALRSTAKGSAPESSTRESFTSAAEPKMSEADKSNEGTLEAGSQTPQRRALGKARGEAGRSAPMAKGGKPKDMSKAGPSMFRYSIMKKEVAGHYSEAQPTTIFQHGDQVRLAIEPDNTGYLYVFAQDVAGNSKVVFPPEGPTATARVEKMVQYLIPPAGDFTFEQPGDLRLTMIFSRKPLADFRHIPESLPALKRERTDVAGATGQEGVKSLTPAAPGTETSIIRREITLRHP
jgi:hypothetical protein